MLPKNKNQISLTCNHKHFSATIMEFKKTKQKRNPKILGIVRTALVLKNHLPELLSSFKRIQKPLYNGPILENQEEL